MRPLFVELVPMEAAAGLTSGPSALASAAGPSFVLLSDKRDPVLEGDCVSCFGFKGPALAALALVRVVSL